MEENKQPVSEDNEEQPEEINKVTSDPDNDVEPLISPIAAAFIGLVGGFFLYQIIGGLLTLIIFGFNLESIPVNSLRLMTMAGQILFILLPALVFSKWIYIDVGKIIRIHRPEWKEVGLFFLGIVILSPLLQSFLFIIHPQAVNSNMVIAFRRCFIYYSSVFKPRYYLSGVKNGG